MYHGYWFSFKVLKFLQRDTIDTFEFSLTQVDHFISTTMQTIVSKNPKLITFERRCIILTSMIWRDL